MSIKIVHVDDEGLEVFVNGESIISANHDDDGWRGMERIEMVVRSIAAHLDIKLVEEHE